MHAVGAHYLAGRYVAAGGEDASYAVPGAVIVVLQGPAVAVEAQHARRGRVGALGGAAGRNFKSAGAAHVQAGCGAGGAYAHVAGGQPGHDRGQRAAGAEDHGGRRVQHAAGRRGAVAPVGEGRPGGVVGRAADGAERLAAGALGARGEGPVHVQGGGGASRVYAGPAGGIYGEFRATAQAVDAVIAGVVHVSVPGAGAGAVGDGKAAVARAGHRGEGRPGGLDGEPAGGVIGPDAHIAGGRDAHVLGPHAAGLPPGEQQLGAAGIYGLDLGTGAVRGAGDLELYAADLRQGAGGVIEPQLAGTGRLAEVLVGDDVGQVQPGSGRQGAEAHLAVVERGHYGVRDPEQRGVACHAGPRDDGRRDIGQVPAVHVERAGGGVAAEMVEGVDKAGAVAVIAGSGREADNVDVGGHPYAGAQRGRELGRYDAAGVLQHEPRAVAPDRDGTVRHVEPGAGRGRAHAGQAAGLGKGRHRQERVDFRRGVGRRVRGKDVVRRAHLLHVDHRCAGSGPGGPAHAQLGDGAHHADFQDKIVAAGGAGVGNRQDDAPVAVGHIVEDRQRVLPGYREAAHHGHRDVEVMHARGRVEAADLDVVVHQQRQRHGEVGARRNTGDARAVAHEPGGLDDAGGRNGGHDGPRGVAPDGGHDGRAVAGGHHVQRGLGLGLGYAHQAVAGHNEAAVLEPGHLLGGRGGPRDHEPAPRLEPDPVEHVVVEHGALRVAPGEGAGRRGLGADAGGESGLAGSRIGPADRERVVARGGIGKAARRHGVAAEGGVGAAAHRGILAAAHVLAAARHHRIIPGGGVVLAAGDRRVGAGGGLGGGAPLDLQVHGPDAPGVAGRGAAADALGLQLAVGRDPQAAGVNVGARQHAGAGLGGGVREAQPVAEGEFRGPDALRAGDGQGGTGQGQLAGHGIARVQHVGRQGGDGQVHRLYARRHEIGVVAAQVFAGFGRAVHAQAGAVEDVDAADVDDIEPVQVQVLRGGVVAQAVGQGGHAGKAGAVAVEPGRRYGTGRIDIARHPQPRAQRGAALGRNSHGVRQEQLKRAQAGAGGRVGGHSHGPGAGDLVAAQLQVGGGGVVAQVIGQRGQAGQRRAVAVILGGR